MKYFILFMLILISSTVCIIPSVYAKLTDGEKILDFDKDSNESLIMPDLYNIHNTVVCGAVIGKDPDKITLMPDGSSYMKGSSYSIKVEKYFKNSNPNSTIDALGSEDSNGSKSMLPFEIGQIGLFYIDEIDEKTHVLSPDSIKVKMCKSIYLQSPLKQFKSGITADQIQCNVGLVLIQKIDYSPACVKSESLEKFRERGWAKLLFEIQIQPDQTYQEDEEVSESNYDPSQVRCSSDVIPYIPKNWQTTGMHPSGETWEPLIVI